jgi:phosphoglucomutase
MEVNIYKIYTESFHGSDQLHRILEEAQIIVNDAIAAGQQSEMPFKINIKEKT